MYVCVYMRERGRLRKTESLNVPFGPKQDQALKTFLNYFKMFVPQSMKHILHYIY